MGEGSGGIIREIIMIDERPCHYLKYAILTGQAVGVFLTNSPFLREYRKRLRLFDHESSLNYQYMVPCVSADGNRRAMHSWDAEVGSTVYA
jgi:hypothetical protein